MTRRGRQRPAFDGGFGQDETVTEDEAASQRWLDFVRVSQDAPTAPFEGASDLGVMGPDTEPFPAPRQQARLRAVPAQDRTHADTDPAPVAEYTARGWPHLLALACRCGAEHHDPAAGTFDRLRKSAQAAGWHIDALGHWTCERCQMDPHYRTLYPLALYAVSIPESRAAEWVLERTRLHHDLSHARGRHAQAVTS